MGKKPRTDLGDALRAATADVVWLRDPVAPIQEDLNDFVVVPMCRQDDGGDIWGEGTRGYAAQEPLKDDKHNIHLVNVGDVANPWFTEKNCPTYDIEMEIT